MKTSTSTSSTTMRNWSVDDLLGSPLLEQGIGQHSRHFHQLFHQLRLRQSRALNSMNRKGKLGTSITCSATAGTKLRKKESTSTGCSTICSTGTSRASTSSKMPLCCTIAPCGCTSTRGVGRVPGGGGFCRRGNSRSSTSLALVVCRRSAASRSTLLALWWSCSARAIATVCRSCRNMQRSRRSLRRRAEPAPRTSRSPSMATPRDKRDRPPHCCERP